MTFRRKAAAVTWLEDHGYRHSPVRYPFDRDVWSRADEDAVLRFWHGAWSIDFHQKD